MSWSALFDIKSIFSCLTLEKVFPAFEQKISIYQKTDWHLNKKTALQTRIQDRVKMVAPLPVANLKKSFY